MVDSIRKPQNNASINPNSDNRSPASVPVKYRLDVELQMAKLWHEKGKIDRAIAGYRKVLAADPNHWLSLLAMEELLVAKGEEKTAIALYRETLDRYRQTIQYYTINERVKRAKNFQHNAQIEKAIEEYKQALEIKPADGGILWSLEEIFTEQGDLASAIALYRRAIERSPNEAELHKRHINLIVAEEGIDAAFEYYELARVDEKAIAIAPSALLCCSVVRNESARLPYFLNYYRQKGVDRFLVIDNGSTDGSLDYLRQQEDVYLWSSNKSFNSVNFGSVWFELLLRRYGIDRWCLTVDADELLYYLDCEHKTIPQLCAELDQRNYRAYTAILLDMYSDRSIPETHYQPGENFLAVCPYFDRQYYHRKQAKGGPYRNQTIYFGGLRERVFGKTGEFILSKVPLLKYGSEMVMSGGQHITNLPASKITKESGCLLHFKYFSLFSDYVAKEVNRKEHYGNAHQYAEYFRTLSANSSLQLYDQQYSLRLENSRQLVEIGILELEIDKDQTLAPEFPKILPLPLETPRPFWSVMITAYKRSDYLEKALSSVLEQAPDAAEMQIEVINDGAPSEIAEEIKAIVDRVGGGRVSFYRHPENLGHPYIFNLCIKRARGQWVHLLHDDDWVAPGFYEALRSGIERDPSVGSAFCRFQIVDEAGENDWISHIERGTPGILPHWLERIAVLCRLQFPAVVVRRSVYETLGGFSPNAGSAFDWEMWQRVALRYPVWYEPRQLAYFRSHERAESHHLALSGRQISDARAAIEIARTYLPLPTTEPLSTYAIESCAHLALKIAKSQLKRGDSRAAIAAIEEALQYSRSEGVQQAIAKLFLDLAPED